LCAIPDADVRPLFHSAHVLQSADADATLESLRERAQWRIDSENWLSVAPAYFDLLKSRCSELGAIETLPLRGLSESAEKALFAATHYDVRLHVGTQTETVDIAEWLDWGTGEMTIDGLRTRLSDRNSGLGICKFPAANLLPALKAHQWLMEGGANSPRPEVDSETGAPANGIDLEQLWALEAELDLAVHVRRTGVMNVFCDIAFLPRSMGNVLPRYPETAKLSGDYDRLARNPFAAAVGKRLTGELRSFLKEQLPEYMVPAVFVGVQALPLTGNGKVNYRGLPEPQAEMLVPGRQLTPPASLTEASLLKIWIEAFGNDNIGVEDNIFDIGGDSLLVFRLAALSNRAGIQLTPRTIFQYRNIRDLARFLAAQNASEFSGTQPKLIRVSRPRTARQDIAPELMVRK
jgi:acyl carrier protein